MSVSVGYNYDKVINAYLEGDEEDDNNSPRAKQPATEMTAVCFFPLPPILYTRTSGWADYRYIDVDIWAYRNLDV